MFFVYLDIVNKHIGNQLRNCYYQYMKFLAHNVRNHNKHQLKQYVHRTVPKVFYVILVRHRNLRFQTEVVILHPYHQNVRVSKKLVRTIQIMELIHHY